jgi:hypothetical protein
MSNISAFQPQCPTIAFTTSATPNTSTSVTVVFPVVTGEGLGHSPMQARVRTDLANTADIWISFAGDGNGGKAATIATAGSGTIGTPSQQMPYAPNSVEIAAGLGGHAVSVNFISSVASQKFYVTFGEGL